MFTAVGEDYCLCENSSIKSFVAPEEAACNLIKYPYPTQWLGCIVGNVVIRI